MSSSLHYLKKTSPPPPKKKLQFQTPTVCCFLNPSLVKYILVQVIEFTTPFHYVGTYYMQRPNFLHPLLQRKTLVNVFFTPDSEGCKSDLLYQVPCVTSCLSETCQMSMFIVADCESSLIVTCEQEILSLNNHNKTVK